MRFKINNNMRLNDFLKISIRALAESKKSSIFATLLEKGISIRIQIRAFSSAGSEHLPYKQRVGGSNPSTPTKGLANRRH